MWDGSNIDEVQNFLGDKYDLMVLPPLLRSHHECPKLAIRRNQGFHAFNWTVPCCTWLVLSSHSNELKTYSDEAFKTVFELDE